MARKRRGGKNRKPPTAQPPPRQETKEATEAITYASEDDIDSRDDLDDELRDERGDARVGRRRATSVVARASPRACLVGAVRLVDDILHHDKYAAQEHMS